MEGKEEKQILISGYLSEDKENYLSIFIWNDNQLIERLDKKGPFSKIFVLDIDGKDEIQEIALWKWNRLEAYDINLYRYKDGKLMEDISLQQFYFKEVVAYYRYLCTQEPNRSIYRKYLEDAERKYTQKEEKYSYKTFYSEMESQSENENMKKQSLKEIVEEEIITEIKISVEPLTLFYLTTGYIEKWNNEADIYLVGREKRNRE